MSFTVIQKNSANTEDFSLAESQTLDNPVYLFEFISDGSTRKMKPCEPMRRQEKGITKILPSNRR